MTATKPTLRSMDVLAYDTTLDAVRAGLPGWMECRTSEQEVIRIFDYETFLEWTLFSGPMDREDWQPVRGKDPVQFTRMYGIECGDDFREVYPSDLMILDQAVNPPDEGES